MVFIFPFFCLSFCFKWPNPIHLHLLYNRLGLYYGQREFIVENKQKYNPRSERIHRKHSHHNAMHLTRLQTKTVKNTLGTIQSGFELSQNNLSTKNNAYCLKFYPIFLFFELSKFPSASFLLSFFISCFYYELYVCIYWLSLFTPSLTHTHFASFVKHNGSAQIDVI